MELPEHLRTGPLADAAQKALADAANMASASNSVPRISLKGREFRLIEGGDEIAKFRDTLNVIIMGVEPSDRLMVKTFYKNGYTQGAKEPPTCSSDNGIAPDHWVQEKQNPVCASCPKNQYGSAVSASGKQSKACRDSKRVWLKLDSSQLAPKGDKPYEPAQLPLKDRILYGLNVTVASLKAFADHGKVLQGLGQGPAVCVTQLTMMDQEFPQLDFKLISWLNADDAPQSLKIADDRPWKSKYANAGLALAMGDTQKSTLPTQLPGVPAHLQKQAEQPVEDAVETQPKVQATTAEIDDAIKNW